MKPKVVQLTLIDKQILESYRSLVEGLGNYLGFGYEIVLHSLEDFKHSVVYIKNGEHTGRTVGAPITDMTDFAKINEVYSEYFVEEYPARSCVAVKELPKNASFELEVIACK